MLLRLYEKRDKMPRPQNSGISFEQAYLSIPKWAPPTLLTNVLSGAPADKMPVNKPPEGFQERVINSDVPPALKGNIDLRKNPDVRKRLSGPAVRTFFNIADAWDLTVSEQCGLLGWIAPSTYHKYRSGNIGTLTYDGLIRISLVIGIYKALHILYPDDNLADRWVKLPNDNPLFSGKPALSVMIDIGIDGLYKVRRLLDSRRGGWN